MAILLINPNPIFGVLDVYLVDCCRDVGGRPQYNFTKLDQLMDLLWINGLRPGISLSPLSPLSFSHCHVTAA